MRPAGDRLARYAYENSWSETVINGCIRDSEEISSITVGVKALHTAPGPSVKRGVGERDVPVSFAGIALTPDTTSTPTRTGYRRGPEPVVLSP
jgi:regulator of ribonuclease activity A